MCIPRVIPEVSSALGTPRRRARVPPLLGQLCARAACLRGHNRSTRLWGKTVSEVGCLYFSRMTVTWLQRMGSSQPPERVLTTVSVPAGKGHVTHREPARQSHKVHFVSRRSLGHVLLLGISFACRRGGPAECAEVGSEGSGSAAGGTRRAQEHTALVICGAVANMGRL